MTHAPITRDCLDPLSGNIILSHFFATMHRPLTLNHSVICDPLTGIIRQAPRYLPLMAIYSAQADSSRSSQPLATTSYPSNRLEPFVPNNSPRTAKRWRTIHRTAVAHIRRAFTTRANPAKSLVIATGSNRPSAANNSTTLPAISGLTSRISQPPGSNRSAA